MVYAFRSGARVPVGVTADAVIRERDKIAKAKGEASVEVVTDMVEAEPKKFPALAKFLTWDPRRAARKQHEQEVRTALNSIVIVETVRGEEIRARALVVVVNQRGNREYEHTVAVLQRPDQRDALFQEIEDTLREATNKVAEFRKLDKYLRENGRAAA